MEMNNKIKYVIYTDTVYSVYTHTPHKLAHNSPFHFKFARMNES